MERDGGQFHREPVSDQPLSTSPPVVARAPQPSRYLQRAHLVAEEVIHRRAAAVPGPVTELGGHTGAARRLPVPVIEASGDTSPVVQRAPLPNDLRDDIIKSAKGDSYRAVKEIDKRIHITVFLNAASFKLIEAEKKAATIRVNGLTNKLTGPMNELALNYDEFHVTIGEKHFYYDDAGVPLEGSSVTAGKSPAWTDPDWLTAGGHAAAFTGVNVRLVNGRFLDETGQPRAAQPVPTPKPGSATMLKPRSLLIKPAAAKPKPKPSAPNPASKRTALGELVKEDDDGKKSRNDPGPEDGVQ